MATSNNMSTSNSYVKYTITITQNSQSVSNNTSNVTVSVRFFRTNVGYETYGSGTIYCKINGTTYSASVSPSQRITNAGIVLFSHTLNIGHNNDGSKYLDTSAWISLNTPLTSSEQWYGEWLSHIPRAATISSAPNFNDEQNPAITYNNPAGNTVSSLQACISLTGSTDDVVYRDISKTGSSYTFNLTNSERNVLRNATTTSNSRTVYFYVRTVLSGNTSHFSLGRTLSIVNSNPVFTASQLTYQDTNSTVTAITGDNQIIVRNKSTLSCNFTAASPQKSATISKYQTIFNGAITDRSSAGTYSLGVVNSAQNLTLQVKAIDSRNNSTTISKTVQILDWVPPIINATAARVNNFENQTNLFANVQISSVNELNMIELLQYRAKKTSDIEWGSWTDCQNNTETQISLDNLYAWNLEIRCSDKFDSATQNLIVPKGMPIMFFDTNKLSVGVGCFPSSDNSLEVINFISSGNSNISGKDVIFQSGTWNPTPIADNGGLAYALEYRYARYYRINSLVYITFHMKFNITNSGSGYAQITGLPYIAGSGNNGQGLAIRELSINTSGVNNATAYVLDNTSAIRLSTGSGIMAQAWANGTAWAGMTGFYLIDTL